MKIFQLYYKMPFPINDGGAFSVYSSSLCILTQNVNLKILAMDQVRCLGDPDLIPDDFRTSTRFEYTTVDNRIKPIRAFINLFTKRSYFVERFHSKNFELKLIEILKDESFDVIQLEHLYLCLYLPLLRKHSNAKVVLRGQNVEYLLWQNYSDKVLNPFTRLFLKISTKRLKAFETNMVGAVDGVMAMSTIDASLFKDLNPTVIVCVVPIGIQAGKKPNDIKTPSNIFYHLGSMDWKPNIQGMKWFVQEVLPIFSGKHPNAQLYIAGKNMPSWFSRRAGKNLIVHSGVASAVQFTEDKGILVVPLLSGSGVRVKILEAAAKGKCIISTSIGSEGLPFINGKDILIADSAEKFAEHMSRCYLSAEQRLKLATGAMCVVQQYDHKNIGASMMEFYQSLLFTNMKNIVAA